jgi:hypothetical protein
VTIRDSTEPSKACIRHDYQYDETSVLTSNCITKATATTSLVIDEMTKDTTDEEAKFES